MRELSNFDSVERYIRRGEGGERKKILAGGESGTRCPVLHVGWPTILSFIGPRQRITEDERIPNVWHNFSNYVQSIDWL